MKRFIMLALSIFLLALLVSCNDDSDSSDSTTTLKTVRAYASYSTDLYTADVGEGKDTDGDDYCDTYSYFEDEVSVTIHSTVKKFLPENVDPSPLMVKDYTVRFIPHEDSPDVPSKTFSHDLIVGPGSSGSMPIRLIDREDKLQSSTHPFNHNDYILWSNNTGNSAYEYTVKVEINMEELFIAEEESIELTFPLEYEDVGDGCIPP